MSLQLLLSTIVFLIIVSHCHALSDNAEVTPVTAGTTSVLISTNTSMESTHSRHSMPTAHSYFGSTNHSHSGTKVSTGHSHSGSTAHSHSGSTAHSHSGSTAHSHSGSTALSHSHSTPHSILSTSSEVTSQTAAPLSFTGDSLSSTDIATISIVVCVICFLVIIALVAILKCLKKYRTRRNTNVQLVTAATIAELQSNPTDLPYDPPHALPGKDLPHSAPPSPRSAPPSPRSVSPSPCSVSPSPRSVPPSPRSVPPSPRSVSPSPRSVPPSPHVTRPPSCLTTPPHPYPPSAGSTPPSPQYLAPIPGQAPASEKSNPTTTIHKSSNPSLYEAEHRGDDSSIPLIRVEDTDHPSTAISGQGAAKPQVKRQILVQELDDLIIEDIDEPPIIPTRVGANIKRL